MWTRLLTLSDSGRFSEADGDMESPQKNAEVEIVYGLNELRIGQDPDFRTTKVTKHTKGMRCFARWKRRERVLELRWFPLPALLLSEGGFVA